MSSPLVNFRADPKLLEALREAAERGGVTVSELIRNVMKQAVQPGETREYDPYLNLHRAAIGDLEALRALVAVGFGSAVFQTDLVAGIEGLVFARLAAVRGDASDSNRLLHLLQAVQGLALQEGWRDYAAQLEGEALAHLSRLADAGDEEAGTALVGLSEGAGADVMVIAQDIGRRMTEAGGE